MWAYCKKAIDHSEKEKEKKQLQRAVDKHKVMSAKNECRASVAAEIGHNQETTSSTALTRVLRLPKKQSTFQPFRS